MDAFFRRLLRASGYSRLSADTFTLVRQIGFDDSDDAGSLVGQLVWG